MENNTLINSYMLWMAHLDDNVKMQLAIALLQSIKLPSVQQEPSATPKWEGETADELMDIIYSARNLSSKSDE